MLECRVRESRTLDGEVASWGEKWAIKSAAWSVPGVRFVEDNLAIGKW
jgi:osmotically-inducible protein OsmY